MKIVVTTFFLLIWLGTAAATLDLSAHCKYEADKLLPIALMSPALVIYQIITEEEKIRCI